MLSVGCDEAMSRWVAAMRLTGVGFFIAACILLGVFGGMWLGSKVCSRPLFMIAGLLIGLAVALLGVYRMLRPLMNNGQDKEDS